MPQEEFVPQSYALLASTASSLHLQSTEHQQERQQQRHAPVNFTFDAIRPGLFRTTFSSSTHPLPPIPSAQKPEADPSCDVTAEAGPNCCSLRVGDVEARVAWDGPVRVRVGFAGEEPLHEDLPFRAYALDGPGAAHYTRHLAGDILHLGLGEKAAPMDLSGRHFRLEATDCFGYDAHRTDPMYKHIPLLIRAAPTGTVAVFSTSHSRGSYSVGAEMDGMWGRYKVYRQDHGGLELYTLVARTLAEVVRLYADLVGYPLLVPRWAFGYLGGGMRYSMLDSPRAADALLEWAETVARHEIPCSGFQLSSGYTVSEHPPHTRNVFTWNRHRFPDPEAFCAAFRSRGIRLIANVKPYLLASHPSYPALAAAGGLFTDPHTASSASARLWSAGGGESGEGGHIDFSSAAGSAFWREGVKALRRSGMECMWNDNNEYVVPSDSWQLALDDPSLSAAAAAQPRRDLGLWGRALHTELHARASFEALSEVAPRERPFVLTRSATAGTMRYACSSWSGDNTTSWAGMRAANAISLTAGVCLLQCYGHDIGGFEGPQPSPELLLRWVQLGVHSPRFAINCFKTSPDDRLTGAVIEPWMFPEILPLVRSALRRRYELLPYLYSLMLESHLSALPPVRWTGWDAESDPEVWRSALLREAETQYWLGDALLIAGVFAPGEDSARVYLPRNEKTQTYGFFNTHQPFGFLAAGAWHDVPSEWQSSIPVLARVGAAVPVGRPFPVAVAEGDLPCLPREDYRGVEVFPPPREKIADGMPFVSSWLEDDGISPPPLQPAKFTVRYGADGGEVRILVKMEVSEGGFVPGWARNGVVVILPVGDDRKVVSGDGEGEIVEESKDESGRRRWRIPLGAGKE